MYFVFSTLKWLFFLLLSLRLQVGGISLSCLRQIGVNPEKNVFFYQLKGKVGQKKKSWNNYIYHKNDVNNYISLNMIPIKQ